jgi:hypothetical protein
MLSRDRPLGDFRPGVLDLKETEGPGSKLEYTGEPLQYEDEGDIAFEDDFGEYTDISGSQVRERRRQRLMLLADLVVKPGLVRAGHEAR